MLKSNVDETWSLFDNCADVVERAINAGGINTPKFDAINTPENLFHEINNVQNRASGSVQKTKGIKIQRIGSRVESRRKNMRK